MLACGGCATAVPIVAGAAGSTPVVGQYLDQGEADSFWIARYDDVVQATLRAGETLSLELDHEETGEDHTELHFSDDHDQEIVLIIERRTESVTRVHFDAGSQEFAGFARLLAQQIIQELRNADAFLVNWSDSNPLKP